MRLVTFDAGNGPRAGVLHGDNIAPVTAPSVRAILADGGAVQETGERVARGDVRLLAPVPDPEKIICMGLNYRDHAEEAHQDIPEHPRWFAKFANSLVGDGADIVLPPAHAEYVDYEAELAVVMGRDGQIAGAMPFNDVSARDLQLQNPLWTSGKAIDTFAPCGPALVTIDEAGDLEAPRAVRTRVNGELLQDGSTKDLIFGIQETVDWLARTMTFAPGDIIATGTPAGVGGFQGRFLRAGDTVEVEVEGLGAVSNPVIEPVSSDNIRMTDTVAEVKSDRQARRREATRTKLIDAAKVLFGRQGVDNTRIQEITDEADVGFGSFYNHFESKEAIVEAVFEETVAAKGAALDELTSAFEDPAEVIAAAHRYFVRLARTEPAWAWLLIHLDVSHNIVREALGPFARRDLRRGVKSGRLKVAHEEVALVATGGAMLTVMRGVLDGHLPKDADVYHAEGVLRMLGLSAKDAAEVARRPLPSGLPA